MVLAGQPIAQSSMFLSVISQKLGHKRRNGEITATFKCNMKPPFPDYLKLFASVSTVLFKAYFEL